jgi:hypothetical protein
MSSLKRPVHRTIEIHWRALKPASSLRCAPVYFSTSVLTGSKKVQKVTGFFKAVLEAINEMIHLLSVNELELQAISERYDLM